MPKLTDHPSREELSAYSLGQLPEERAVAIDSHISECEPCCETIVELSSEDTFAGLLQEAGRLPTDQTADHDSATANSASFDDIPQPLSEHPRYEILGLIGKGGMGDVYKARHRKMERTVALKVINRGLVQKAEAIDRFHREVKAAAQLSHPNIVTSYDADHAGDFHFMVMEFVDGVDLSQTVKKRGALPVAEACDYIRQAAIGLQHAHERGMVHRDIKPHNLMVTADGTIKILDFGLASLAPEAIPASDAVAASSDLTAAGAIMGTPDFISPEQAEDARKADIRSDIYSLGATLYYLLSGRVPFDDGSVMHKLKSHAQVEPAPLNSVRDDVPEELVAIASKMMAKDPDERYLTPKEVADALESFLRTWQPGTSGPDHQAPSNDGNMSGSGNQTKTAGGMNPDWLLVLARILLVSSLIPVALICYDLWNWNDTTYAKLAARTWTLMNITLCVSTFGGIVFGIHRYRTQRHNDRRVYRWTATEAILISFILITGFLCFIPAKNIDQINSSEPSPFLSQFRAAEKISDQEQREQAFAALAMNAATAGEVKLTKRALEHIVRSEKQSPAQRDCAIALFNNGMHDEAYGLAESIYYQVDRDAALLAFVQSEKPFDRSVTASTSLSSPELKITGKTVNKGTSGFPSVYDWNFKGYDVGELTVRLLLAQNGKTEVVQEFDFEELPAEFANKIRLEVKDDARSPKGRRVNAVLFVESPVSSRSATVNEDKVFSIDVEEAFRDRIEQKDLTTIASGQTELLLALGY